MTLHILKRDLIQLGPLVAIVALAQFSSAASWFALGHFEEPRGLVFVAYVFSGVTALGIVTLITSVVHLDILPGVSQDWLIRPIRRTDLLFAKLLFVLIAVHVPMILADLAHGLGMGFSATDSLRSAMIRSLSVLLILDVPVLALAAITRSLVQVGAAVLGIWIAVVAGVLISVLARGGNPPPFAASGLQWMTPTFWSLLAIAAGVLIVPIQYFRRATAPARIIAVGAALLAPTLSYSTWASVFAVQKALSPDPTTVNSLTIAYDPAIGRSTSEPSVLSPTAILLPLRVSGLAADSFVLNDRTNVRIVAQDGTSLYSGRTTVSIGYGDDFPVRSTAAGDVLTHQRIGLPAKVYANFRNQSVRMELDYSLTLFHAEAATSIPAMNGSVRSVAFGWCRTEIDEDGDGVQLGCLSPGVSPTCFTAMLANPQNGKRNPENIFCDPDYAPFHVHVFPTAISRVGGEFKFRDLQNLAKYPVDGAQLADATVTLKSYRPVAHFTRRLLVPEIRLADWVVGATTDATPAP